MTVFSHSLTQKGERRASKVSAICVFPHLLAWADLGCELARQEVDMLQVGFASVLFEHVRSPHHEQEHTIWHMVV